MNETEARNRYSVLREICRIKFASSIADLTEKPFRIVFVVTSSSSSLSIVDCHCAMCD